MQWRAALVGGGGSEAQILHHQLGVEAALVVPRGGDSLHDTLPASVPHESVFLRDLRNTILRPTPRAVGTQYRRNSSTSAPRFLAPPAVCLALRAPGAFIAEVLSARHWSQHVLVRDGSYLGWRLWKMECPSSHGAQEMDPTPLNPILHCLGEIMQPVHTLNGSRGSAAERRRGGISRPQSRALSC